MTTHKDPENKKKTDPFSPENFEKLMKELGATKVDKEQYLKDQKEAFKTLKHAFSLPDSSETTAIAIGLEKTAALFYDRVWAVFAPMVPEEIHFCGATKAEFEIITNMIGALRDKDFNDEKSFSHFVGEKFKTYYMASWTLENGRVIETKKMSFQRAMAEALLQEHKIPALPIYVSEKEKNSDFSEGNKKAIIASLLDLPLPIEDDMSWEQVIELRSDEKSRTNLRRLIHWFDKEMADKSINYVSDNLAIVLDDYKRSLKKHGVRTALSLMAGTFSAISIPTILTHMSSQPLWMSLVEGLLIGGGSVAKIAEKYIDTKPEPPQQIAWVYEVKKKMK